MVFGKRKEVPKEETQPEVKAETKEVPAQPEVRVVSQEELTLHYLRTIREQNNQLLEAFVELRETLDMAMKQE